MQNTNRDDRGGRVEVRQMIAGAAIRTMIGSGVLAVVATTAVVGPVAATQYSPYGGMAFTSVIVDRYAHSLQIRQTVYMDPGTSQTVAARYWFRSSATSTAPASTWLGGTWLTYTTLQFGSGSFGQFNYGPYPFKAGSCFDFVAQYGWSKSTGWYLSAQESLGKFCV